MSRNKSICLSLICILAIGFIFFNSSQTSIQSNARSYRIAEKIIKIGEENKIINNQINIITTEVARIEKFNTNGFVDTTGILNLILRKCAHAFEFFLLALILCLTFSTINIRVINILIYALFIVLFSAVCDEFFQLFILGRTSSIADVLIDFFGGIIACACFVLAKTLSYMLWRYRNKSMF